MSLGGRLVPVVTAKTRETAAYVFAFAAVELSHVRHTRWRAVFQIEVLVLVVANAGF